MATAGEHRCIECRKKDSELAKHLKTIEALQERFRQVVGLSKTLKSSLEAKEKNLVEVVNHCD